MEAATSRYESLVSNAERFSAVAASLDRLLNGLESQRDQIFDSLNKLGSLLEKTSGSLPAIENKVMQLTEQVTFGVKQNQDEMTKVLRDAAVSLQSSIADIRSLLLETTQASSTQINDHVRSLADKTTEQFAKLDAALETELSKSISSLGRQLTALSKQFVDDYTPLTDRLRDVIQMGRG